jgi:hypothetical protein
MLRGRKLKVRGPRIDYAAIAAAGGIGKGPSIPYEKGRKRAAFETALANAYDQVNVRDRNRSRITGKNLFPNTDDIRALREHNHLEPRSTAPARITDPSNIFLVSNYEHAFITSGDLLVHGKDARRDLKFSWNPNTVKAGREPFRIPAAVRYDVRKAAAA